MNFVPSSITTFRFLDAAYDENAAAARLRYGLDDKYLFTEEFRFPRAQAPAGAVQRAALQNAVKLLHLAAGVSYYKAALPPNITVEGSPLSPATAGFFEKLYRGGLAEFAHRNRLSLAGRAGFPADPAAADRAHTVSLPRVTAVPLGGGKDSIVTLEALAAADEPLLAICVGNHAPIAAVAAHSGLPLTVIERRIDPLLLELNRQGAYNGHIPISAIIAFALVAGAILYGYDTIAISQERSANVGSLITEQGPVNHQYSKSLEFERDLRSLLAAHLIGIEYFSFLRPLSELGICRLFASRCPRYLDVFTSCNRAFRLDRAAAQGLWCRDCPKCRFVFLALAPFVPKPRLLAAFGGNPLDDESQLVGFEELLGLGGHKPFECVGEVPESRAAFALAAEKAEWGADAVIKRLRERLGERQLSDWRAYEDEALTPSAAHFLPKRYAETLHAF